MEQMTDLHALFWGFCRSSLKSLPLFYLQVLDWIMYFGHFAGAIFLEVRVDVCGDVHVILLCVPSFIYHYQTAARGKEY